MNKNLLPFILSLALTASIPTPARQDTPQRHGEVQSSGPAWSELEQSMAKMHVEMESTKPSGNPDIDFVRLMLPHHQAAIAMAKAELIHGKDPQMRRLAQEIITDQQSEIELLKLWLSGVAPARKTERD